MVTLGRRVITIGMFALGRGVIRMRMIVVRFLAVLTSIAEENQAANCDCDRKHLFCITHICSLLEFLVECPRILITV